MFRAMLFTQWKWTRIILLPLSVIGFAIPVFSIQAFGSASPSRWQVSSMLGTMQATGFFYLMLSLLLGMLVSAGTWSFDTKSRHVYALSLPIPRWHYLLLRYAAGALLLVVPTVLLWIGALLATSSAEIPIGLHAYPTALAVRFLLSSFMIYSLVFAMSSLPKRIGIIVAVSIVAVVAALSSVDYLRGNNMLMGGLLDWAVRWPGFLEVAAGRWMLIDV